MKRAIVLTAIVALGLSIGFLRCGQKKTDEEAIKELLNTSSYTSEQHDQAYGSEDSTVTTGGEEIAGLRVDNYDTIPFVRFRRYVPKGGVSRTIEIKIPAYPGYPDTTALATITSDIHGELRTMFDTTTNPIQVWCKPFHDQAVRKVYLTKHEHRWCIRKVSPLAVRTMNAAYELRLDSVIAVASSGENFKLTTGDTLLAKEELPTFVPHDTVQVQVFLSSNGDSAWVFLHHGWRWRQQNQQRTRGWRRPYGKRNTFSFEWTWCIGPEGYNGPEVRPSVHDAIGWGSLWADTTAPYVSAAWGIPYIVKNINDQIPEE